MNSNPLKVRTANLKQVPIRTLWEDAYADDAVTKSPHLRGTDLVGTKIGVLSYDPDAKSFVGKTATRVFQTQKDCYEIHLFSSGSPLKASAQHQHWAKLGGAVSWVRTSELTSDHHLLSSEGSWLRVNHVVNIPGVHTMYDLEVPETNSYVANGVVTHNSHTVLQLSKTQAELGYKVVVVPLEMTEQEEAIRLLSNVGQTDSLKISLDKLADEERDFLWRRYKKFQRKVEAAGGRFTIYRPRSDVTIEETMAAIHSYNPDVIYIDYIGLLKGADGDDQWRQLGKIARYGKVYAGNHNKAVVLAAQVDEDGRVRYSQAIKEHASLGFTFVATKESREGGYLNFSMLKGRNQQLMNFTLRCDYSTSTIRDLDPKEQDAMEGAPTEGKGKKPTKDGAPRKKDDFMPDMD